MTRPECVTGFDVHRFGYIGVAGGDDAVRGVALVLLGMLAGTVHAFVAARRDPVRHEAEPKIPSPLRTTGMKEMADLAYVLLTVAIFALFGLVVRAVERL